VNTALWQLDAHGSQYVRCWALSIALHGTAIGVALALLSDLHLPTQPDAFRWQVSVIGMTHPSAVQKTTAPPMDPRSAPPTPISVNEPAPVQKNSPAPRQAVAPPVTAREISRMTARPLPSSNVPPQVVAPADPSQSTPSETVTPMPSLNELPPPAASSAPTEEPAVSPSRDVSLDTPSDVAPTRIPEARSSTGHSPSLSPSIQEATIQKPDFSWLTDSLRGRVQQSQKYSTVARLNGLEGRVVLRITVKDNGELLVAIATSSGHALLDQDAVEQVTRLSPLPLLQPLGRTQQVLNLPIIYSLHQ
jgi:TonB family C-terminal domain